MKFYSYNKEIRDGLKEKYPIYYEKLMSKYFKLLINNLKYLCNSCSC